MIDAAKIPEIQAAIAAYASAYAALEAYQGEQLPLPRGDQKTGCIGEFYALLFLLASFPHAKITRAGHSTKGWDFDVAQADGMSMRYQVKTVSAFATERRLSPIHHGWDRLLVFHLDRQLKPTGFWVATDNSIVAQGECLKGMKCASPDGRQEASAVLRLGPNRIEEWRRTVEGLGA